MSDAKSGDANGSGGADTVVALCQARLAAIGAALARPDAKAAADEAAGRSAAAAAVTALAGATQSQSAALDAAEKAARAYTPGSAADAALAGEALALIALLRTHPPQRELWSLAYQEAGEWARHFSAVRATVSTFLIGIAVGVLSFGWNESAWSVFATMACVVWVLMLVLLVVFSWNMRIRWWQQQTNEEKMGLRALFGSAGSVPERRPGRGAAFDLPVIVVLVLTAGFGGAVWYRSANTPTRPLERVEVITAPSIDVRSLPGVDVRSLPAPGPAIGPDAAPSPDAAAPPDAAPPTDDPDDGTTPTPP